MHAARLAAERMHTLANAHKPSEPAQPCARVQRDDTAVAHTEKKKKKTCTHTLLDSCGRLMTADIRPCAHRHTYGHQLSSALYWIASIQLASIGLGLFEKHHCHSWSEQASCSTLCTIFFCSKLNSNGSCVADGAYPDAVYLDCIGLQYVLQVLKAKD